MKKTILFIIFFTIFQLTNAQCAMCKAVVENSDSDMAESINDGITYLVFFPYFFLAVGLFFYFRNKKKNKNVTTN